MKARIGCSRYDIKKGNKKFDTEILGAVHSDNKQIVIYDGVNAETAKQVFWHEIVHAMLAEIERDDLSDNENFVNILSKHIYAFLEDNSIEKLYKAIAD
jgi:hypothetical protein